MQEQALELTIYLSPQSWSKFCTSSSSSTPNKFKPNNLATHLFWETLLISNFNFLNAFFFGSLTMSVLESPKGHATISSQTFSFSFQDALPTKTNIKIWCHIKWQSMFYYVWKIELHCYEKGWWVQGIWIKDGIKNLSKLERVP
jgi:hypothetical protein